VAVVNFKFCCRFVDSVAKTEMNLTQNKALPGWVPNPVLQNTSVKSHRYSDMQVPYELLT
jgi:hypothetical protein